MIGRPMGPARGRSALLVETWITSGRLGKSPGTVTHERRTTMSAATTELSPVEESPSGRSELPRYSHELAWPEGMAPFKVVDDGTQGDPYAHYAWMRENAPVLRAASPVSDVWFISRYDDVRKAMRAPKVFSSQVVDPVPLTFLTLFDAPNHTRLRQVVAQAFTPKAIARFEDRVRENAHKYLDPMIAAGGGDAVEDYAIPLSMSTISALLDVPAVGLREDEVLVGRDLQLLRQAGPQRAGHGNRRTEHLRVLRVPEGHHGTSLPRAKRVRGRPHRPDVEGRPAQREGSQGTLRLRLRRRP